MVPDMDREDKEMKLTLKVRTKRLTVTLTIIIRL